jgi:hypothetical protein
MHGNVTNGHAPFPAEPWGDTPLPATTDTCSHRHMDMPAHLARSVSHLFGPRMILCTAGDMVHPARVVRSSRLFKSRG